MSTLPMLPTPARAATFDADPRTYRELVTRLAPGDRLALAPGTYEGGLDIRDLHGRDGEPILIEGPAGGTPAVFVADSGRNTVSIRRSSYVTLRNVTLDGRDAGVDAVKAEYGATVVHHIVLEGLTIISYGGDQQVVGISTKAPAAWWTIRNNVIVGAGTGMYLGNSDGSAAFVAGLIEGNLIADTIGYSIEIKQQNLRPASPEMPTAATRTRIRGNIFSKAAHASTGEMARPNVLMGHWPPSGNGAEDEYEVVANVFVSNPGEALFQGEGNVTLRRNMLVNPVGPAVAIQPHHGAPRRITIEDNFVVGQGTGIALVGASPEFTPKLVRNRVVRLQADLGHAPVAASATQAREFALWLTAPPSVAASAEEDRNRLVATLLRACDLAERSSPPVDLAPLASGHYACKAVRARRAAGSM